MNQKGQSTLDWLMTYGWALAVVVITVSALIFLLNPQVPEEPEQPVLLQRDFGSQEACSSFKADELGRIEYYYQSIGVDQNLFWKYWGLKRYGASKVVGERVEIEPTLSGGTELVFECYYEMLRVCDSDFVCQDYSKRFLVYESDLNSWCQGQCLW